MNRKTPLKRTAFKRTASVRESSEACTLRLTAPRKRIKAKRPGKPRRVSVLRDQSYMDWLKDRACLACLKSGTGAQSYAMRIPVIDPAHTIGNGRSSKGPDSSCIPLCRFHHQEMDGQLTTAVTTKAAFAAKYGLDLAKEAAAHWTIYWISKENECV